MSAPSSALGRARSAAVASVTTPVRGFGEWTLFIAQVFWYLPLTVRKYYRQTLAATLNMAWGRGSLIVDGGTIYGNDCEVGNLRAVKLETGERLWETFQPTTGGERRASHGTAFLTKNGDRYFLFSETGDLIIARLTPEKYEELSRAHLLAPTAECFGRSVVWSHPAYANKCVFVRNDKEIVCASLAK